MFIVFKQIFKTLARNGLLIFSLFLVIATIFLMGASSLQLTLSINNSIVDINDKGNASKAMSNVTPTLGNVAFSLENSNPTETRNIYVSSLEPNRNQKIKPGSKEFNNTAAYKVGDSVWTYDTDKSLYNWYSCIKPIAANTSSTHDPVNTSGKGGYWEKIPPYIFNDNAMCPVTYDDLYYTDPNPKKGKQSIRKYIQDNKIKAGLKINQDATNIDDMFEIQDGITADYGYPMWKSFTGAFRKVLTNSPNAGIATSFVDMDDKLATNPHALLYNAGGMPIFYINRSGITDSLEIREYIANIKPDIVNNKRPLDYEPLKRTTRQSTLHDVVWSFPLASTNWISSKNEDSYGLTIYKKQKTLPVYRFKVNLNDTSKNVINLMNSTLLKEKNVDIINDVFDKIFFRFTLKPVNYDKKISDSITYDKNTKEVLLSFDDSALIDYNNPIFMTLPPSDQQYKDALEANKKAYLDSFASYLSLEFSKQLNETFYNIYKELLSQKDIYVNKDRDYLYNDATTGHSLLFVEKTYLKNNQNDFNKVVTNAGSSFNQSNLLDFFSGNKPNNSGAFILSKQYVEGINDIAKKTLPSLSKAAKDTYLWVQYIIYLTDNIIAKSNDPAYAGQYPEWRIPDPILEGKFYRAFTFINSNGIHSLDVLSNNSKINVALNFESIFSTINFPTNISLYNFDNLFVVLSNAYADANKKKSLVSNEQLSSEIQLEWNQELAKPLNEFKSWIDNIKNTPTMILSQEFIKHNLQNQNDKFEYWMDNLPDNYKITYKGNPLLIGGTGISPDFAFPIINATSPIPDPSNQAVVFINKCTFTNLGISDIDINSHLSYGSNSLSASQIVSESENLMNSLIGKNTFEVYTNNNAKPMGIVWMRTYFPENFKNFILICSILIIAFLLLLAFVIIYLLIKSITNNLAYSLAIVISNGFSLRNVTLSCVANAAFISITASILAYFVSFAIQAPLLSIFMPIIFTPISIIPFSPAICFSMILLSAVLVCGTFAAIIIKKFRVSPTQVISKQESVKSSKGMDRLLSLNIKTPLLPKISAGFSSNMMGRLSLLTILGSLSLGIVVSSIMVNQKFGTAKTDTSIARVYQNDINLMNVNQQSGLYKPQPFEEMGTTDTSVGINPIYPVQDPSSPLYNPNYANDNIPDIYNRAHLTILEVDPSNPNNLIPKTYGQQKQNKYLTNLILPSYGIYTDLQKNNQTMFFNAVASLITLNFDISIPGVGDLNIWQQIRSSFPEWLVYQFENQIKEFQKAAMDKYGEMYSYFLNAKPVSDKDDDPYTLDLGTIDENKYGYYYPVVTKKGSKKTYEGQPFFVWKDGTHQLFERQDAIRYYTNDGDNIKLELQGDAKTTFNEYTELTYAPLNDRINEAIKTNRITIKPNTPYDILFDNPSLKKNPNTLLKYLNIYDVSGSEMKPGGDISVTNFNNSTPGVLKFKLKTKGNPASGLITLNYKNNSSKMPLVMDAKPNTIPVHGSATQVTPFKGTIKPEDIQWRFVPAYNQDFSFNTARCTNTMSDPTSPNVDGFFDISLKTNILKLFDLFFGDKELSKKDARISFGIVPVGAEDETYTNVNISIDALRNMWGKTYTPLKNITSIMGIDNKRKNSLIQLKNREGNDLSNLLDFDKNSTSASATIPIVINEGASLEWGLKVGDTMKVTVLNNSITNNYEVLKQLIPNLPATYGNNEYTLEVKGINTDALGEKIYMNQTLANMITGLDKMEVYSSINTSANVVNTLSKKKMHFAPFNSILTKTEDVTIGSSIVPFYSNTGIWNFNTSVDEINSINPNLTLDFVLTRDHALLKQIAPSLGVDPNSPTLREDIKLAMLPNFNNTSFKQAMKAVEGNSSLLVATTSMSPHSVSAQIFDIMSKLISIVIYILISILIPLLVVVIMIVSFSMVEDLFKRIALMKVIGLNNSEITKVLLSMYAPIVLGILILGAGIMVGLAYGLQYAVYTTTSIFLSETIAAGIYIAGVSIILLIFALSILFMALKLKKKQISNAVKF